MSKEALEKVADAKDKIFREPELEKRALLEPALQRIREKLSGWQSGKGGLETKKVLDYLEGISKMHELLLVRLFAFEGMAKLTERHERENRDVVEKMILRILSEPDEEMRNAMLGILGVRLEPKIVIESGNLGPEIVSSLRSQFVNTTDTLINEIAKDPRVGEDVRGFADLVIQPTYKIKDNPLWQRMKYMAHLYNGDLKNFYLELGRLEKEDAGVRAFEQGRFIAGAVGGRRILKEGYVCSLAKELEAESSPRKRPEIERGQIIPLRVFMGVFSEANFDHVILTPNESRAVIAELRRLKNDRRFLSEGRLKEKSAFLNSKKKDIWDSLDGETQKLLGGDLTRLQIKVETLFDENALNELLKNRFGSADVDKIDPSGSLGKEVDKIIGGEGQDGEKLKRIELLLKTRAVDK